MNKLAPLVWKTEKRKLSELKSFEGNPRHATEKDCEDLDKSLDRFGVAAPLVINTNNDVIGGNFRLSRLEEKGVDCVDVRVPNRELTRHEAEELNLRLNRNTASFDNDLLANFGDIDLLKDVGWPDMELKGIFQLDMKEPPPKEGEGRGDKGKKHTCPKCGCEF